jgi:hypothetical protein
VLVEDDDKDELDVAEELAVRLKELLDDAVGEKEATLVGGPRREPPAAAEGREEDEPMISKEYVSVNAKTIAVLDAACSAS